MNSRCTGSGGEFACELEFEVLEEVALGALGESRNHGCCEAVLESETQF
jgi:hypothetical protein